jgi:methanogenic corrinoid protein MtbC1
VTRPLDPSDALEHLSGALVELDEQTTLDLARGALAAGVRSLALVKVCEQAMRIVGERYERHEYYLSGLILAGEIFREVLEMAQPGLEQELAGEATGHVLLGTVAGDIHDIGKNIVVTALRSFGFTVTDLGVDVSAARFAQAAAAQHPDIIGLSGLISSSYHSMKATVALLHAAEAGLEHVPPVILGGGVIDEEVRRYVGADSWSTDAMEGVRICQRMITAGAAPGA